MRRGSLSRFAQRPLRSTANLPAISRHPENRGELQAEVQVRVDKR
jgi:hypothetical protein